MLVACTHISVLPAAGFAVSAIEFLDVYLFVALGTEGTIVLCLPPSLLAGLGLFAIVLPRKVSCILFPTFFHIP